MRDLKTLLGAARHQPFLERDEEQRLARQAGDGDTDAAHRLVLSHVRYVITIARRYRGSGLPMSDLVQEGIVGLLRAIKGYDPTKETRFATYAGWWIRAAIQDHVVRSWSLVRIGTTNAQKALALKLRRMVGGAEDISEDIVTALARRFDTTATEVRTLARRVAGGDFVPEAALVILPSREPSPEQAAERHVLAELLEKALDLLEPREAFIIRRRYFEDVKHTFEAIGRELNLSKDRVRQLEAKALLALREILEPAFAE